MCCDCLCKHKQDQNKDIYLAIISIHYQYECNYIVCNKHVN